MKDYNYKKHLESEIAKAMAEYGSLELAVFELYGKVADLEATIEGMRELEKENQEVLEQVVVGYKTIAKDYGPPYSMANLSGDEEE